MRRFLAPTYFSIGKRVAKTGISVFITSLICLFLGLPAEFAIIAAIVTIEPTAADSIRKGLIRLPASAIGAAYAIIFVAVFGVSAASFTLAAVCTIFTCKKLKLFDGILVATLTAVAMIPDIEGELWITFLSRLGTTSIGIVVSSLVNFFILPPKFLPFIREKIDSNFKLVPIVLSEAIESILEGRTFTRPTGNYDKLRSAVETVHKLSSYQEREWKYHKVTISEYRNYNKLKKTNLLMQKMVLHLGNLQYIRDKAEFTCEERKLLEKFTHSTSHMLENMNVMNEEHCSIVYQLDEMLRHEAEKLNLTKDYFHRFTARRTILFELLSLHDCLEELNAMR